MHGFYTYLEQHPGVRNEPFHEMSHGESFVEVLASRFQGPGLYVLDEPESALSFTNSLGLIGLLHRIVNDGNAQVVVATHSPVVAAIPGATLIELGEWGMRRVGSWQALDLVQDWRAFLDDPDLFLRHLLVD